MSEQNYFRAQIEQNLQVNRGCLEALPDALARAADLLTNSLRMGRKILACGNGGSAGDAQHLASELVNRFETERMALPAIALVPDSSVVTAIANDYSYERLFARQIEALGNPGDVLVAFSTSGNSRNVVQAIKTAQARGMPILAITGRDGGQMATILNQFDVEIRVPSEVTARIQEVHLLTIHSLCKYIDDSFTPNQQIPVEKIQQDWNKLSRFVKGLRPLVFTNGVFDVLHRGHVHGLQEARKLGAYLVVGVNSDASVKRLGKGTDRPIQPQDDRMAILAGLGCVDFVTMFDDDTPSQLIETLSPDVLAKGGDYAPDQIAGADFVNRHGGRVVTIPFAYDRSTTDVIARIRGTSS